MPQVRTVAATAGRPVQLLGTTAVQSLCITVSTYLVRNWLKRSAACPSSSQCPLPLSTGTPAVRAPAACCACLRVMASSPGTQTGMNVKQSHSRRVLAAATLPCHELAAFAHGPLPFSERFLAAVGAMDVLDWAAGLQHLSADHEAAGKALHRRHATSRNTSGGPGRRCHYCVSPGGWQCTR